MIEGLLLRIFELLVCLILFLIIRRIKKEEKIRKEQDWKLYNYTKASFNAIVGRKK